MGGMNWIFYDNVGKEQRNDYNSVFGILINSALICVDAQFRQDRGETSRWVYVPRWMEGLSRLLPKLVDQQQWWCH